MDSERQIRQMSQGSINPAAGSLPATTGDVPAWLQAKKKKSPEGTTPPLPSPAGVDLSGEPRPNNATTWGRRLLNYALTAYGLSLLFHLILLVLLSLLFFTTNIPQGLRLFGGMENNSDEPLILDTALSTVQDTPAARFELAPIEALSQTATGFDPLDMAKNSANGSSETDNGDGVAMPSVGIPSFAITKGSFSVWTEPRDPKPRQNYYIIIHVKLPAGQTIYPSSDLTGEVIGSDGYRLVIQTALKQVDTPARIKVKNNGVQLKVFVPGAERLVRDEIRVNSRVLKEKQVIEIEF